jgi:quinol monooxygenase YgiN
VITVLAFIRAKPGREAVVRRELLKLVRATRREKGCINYDLHTDDADPRLFMFHENWTDKAALAAHAASPHMKAWAMARKGLIAGRPRVLLYRMVSRLTSRAST